VWYGYGANSDSVDRAAKIVAGKMYTMETRLIPLVTVTEVKAEYF